MRGPSTRAKGGAASAGGGSKLGEISAGSADGVTASTGSTPADGFAHAAAGATAAATTSHAAEYMNRAMNPALARPVPRRIGNERTTSVRVDHARQDLRPPCA
ncbi:MAG: hypothetical protein HY902_17240 [Deltaproteobacteria bacterium]|nr:hypothetical protein [Deltaproteobacteria bacterium]